MFRSENRSRSEQRQAPITCLLSPALVLTAFLPVSGLAGDGTSAPDSTDSQVVSPEVRSRVESSLARLAFVENRGQWEEGILFLARRPGMTVRVGSDGFQISLCNAPEEGVEESGASLALGFEGGGALAAFGEDALPGTRGYFVGRDAARWAPEVLSYASVRYVEPWKGIDVVLRESGGWLEYDLVLRPGADPDDVVLRCEGARALELDEHGNLVMRTNAGDLVQPPPEDLGAARGRREAPARMPVPQDRRVPLRIRARGARLGRRDRHRSNAPVEPLSRWPLPRLRGEPRGRRQR